MGDDGGRPSRVIAVGSSAGGLAALSEMLGPVRGDLGWCFVVAQHLSPHDLSALTSLLSRVTVLRVVEATDGMALEANAAVVTPPGVDVVIDGAVLRLVEPDQSHRPWPSIDRLLSSAASSLGGDAVGVVLSGTGADGALGVESIRAEGGVVIVQDPASAGFGSMPAAAYDTGSADLQAPACDIAAALERLLPALEGSVDGAGKPMTHPSALVLDDGMLDATIAALRTVVGVDYSGYKRSTLRRQVERRLRILDQPPADYAGVIARDPLEAEALSRSVLIGVTTFFRDPPVWDAAAEQLRGLVGTLDPTTQLRMWVPGCASGEEAYTVAMLAAEALGPNHGDLSGRMKVFATDLQQRALDVARRGRYSADAVVAIPSALRERWFRPIDDDWEVVPALRECLVVTRHNVASDPPFPRLHLISLRNTMIYFQPHVQERVLQVCQFALLPDGMLILGKSEQVPRLETMFTVAVPGHRIYWRSNAARPVPLPVSRHPPTALGVQTVTSRHHHGAALYRRLLRLLAQPSLVVDDDDDLIEVIGEVSPWCAVVEGRHSGHVADVLRDPFRLLVRAMLVQLRHGGPTRLLRQVDTLEGAVEISVARVGGDGASAVISFTPMVASPDEAPSSVAIGPVVSAEQLHSAQDALQATIEDLSTSNEELQALNQELQASAEELQASSEEAQASNEELETLNEELITLNQELQARGMEVTKVNTDLENIQASLTSGLIIVDLDLRILRYSPLAVRMFSIIPEDIGRPLPAVPTTIAVPTLVDDLRETLANRASRLIELGDDTRSLLLQVQPYLGSANEVLGALVSVIDVTETAVAQRERAQAWANLEAVAESVRELVWQCDDAGALTFLTRRVEDIYGLDRDRVLADPSLLAAAVHPADRDRVAAVRASTSSRWQVEYRIMRPDGTIRWIDESAASTDAVGKDRTRSLTGSALDVTDRHSLHAAAARRGAVLDALLATTTVGVLVLGADDRIVQASPSVAALVGHQPHALIGTPLDVLLESDPAVARLPESARTTLNARRVMASDGTYRAVTTEVVEVADVGQAEEPNTAARVIIVHDVTQLRRISADLATREQYDQQTGLLTRAYFLSRTEELVHAGGTGLAVLWIDLDGFKDINDRFGHRSGDAVLAAIATLLRRCTRQRDVLGRLGGDEFAMLVTRAEDLDGIEVLAHRILAAVREPIDVDGTLAYVSASVGIAIYPTDGRTAEELLHNADIAMYAAKQGGRDRHAYFDHDMNERADQRAQVRRDLAAAIRRGDFEMHYQPVIEVSTGQLMHVEALVRWRRGDELATAATFIGHALESGQLPAIGRIVLGLIDADLTTMRGLLGDRQPRVAINLSGNELTERDIVDWLLTWDPAGGYERLIAEVTEAVLLAPQGRAIDTLAVLRRLGATISIDDFGTGYSNLEALDRLQPDIIKMDQSLLHRATDDDGRGTRILRAAIQLAHALNAKVVVEGVQDQQQWTRTARLGADLAQGYFLATAMPLPALLDWISTD